MTDSKNQKIPNQIIFREYFESLIVAVIIALSLRFFVISAYKIPTGSMTPTLKSGDFIFVSKMSYGFPVPFSNGSKIGAQIPLRGDVIVFRLPGAEGVSYVKRVVGLPGDRIEIKAKHLFINDHESSYKEWSDQVISDLPSKEYHEVFQETSLAHHHLVIFNKEQKDQKFESFGPIIVPPDQVFVLGDNRDSSDDSRYWGSVPLQFIEGRALFIWLSFDWLNRWGAEQLPNIRWERQFMIIR